MTSLAMTEASPAVPRGKALQTFAVGTALLLAAIVFGLRAGDLAVNGKVQEVFGFAIILLPLALWRRPQLAPPILIAAAVLVEQVQALPTASTIVGAGPPPAAIPITNNIPLWRGLGSVHLDPSDLLLLMIALIYVLRTDFSIRTWPRSHLSKAMRAFMGTVLLGLFVGVIHHGSTRVAFQQARPFIYLSVTYILTAVLIRSRSSLRAVLWAFVIATGLKALQAVYIFFFEAIHMHPRPDALIDHEPAYFFTVYIILVAALWLFRVNERLRKTATWILPLVILANLLNNRRASWLLLGGAFLALAAIGYVRLPQRRLALRRTAFVLLGVSVLYFPLYWNKAGTLAQPAVAVRSQFSPNGRDELSDLYRVQEDANLKFNISQAGPLGKGLGVPIDYALPIVDLSSTDPNIKYIPHNGVLYIPMDLGLLGVAAFWAVLGTAMVAGCRLTRSADREVALVGALVTCSLVAYALEGATDTGFTFFRIAFVTGVLLGLLEAARQLKPLARTPRPSIA